MPQTCRPTGSGGDTRLSPQPQATMLFLQRLAGQPSCAAWLQQGRCWRSEVRYQEQQRRQQPARQRKRQ